VLLELLIIYRDIRPHFAHYVDFPHNHLDNGPQHYRLVSVEGLTPDKTKEPAMTTKQKTALSTIAAAGPAGLDFYWHPARGRRVLINGNCQGALMRAGLIRCVWSKNDAGQSVLTAHLTVTGFDAEVAL
jgi:hypothetical protein